MSKISEIYICAAKRTAIGSFQGELASLSATELGAAALRGALEQGKLSGELVDEVIMGCVLTAGLGQAPARQAQLAAGVPRSKQALTVNKVCSSGLKAVLLAAQNIQLGLSRAALAGGMESMSQAPYVLPTLRSGARLGHSQAVDTIIKDGLWDVYNDFHMGNAAELCAKKYGLSREAQDRFAISSYERARKAIADGHFSEEIVGITLKTAKTEKIVLTDEEPARSNLEKIPSLKPVFEKNGTVTAANASSINDGAAALLLCSAEFAKEQGLVPLARIVEQGWNSQSPEWFTTAPVGAVHQLLARSRRSVSDIDLFELNEAFSAVALACANDLEIPMEKLNVSGGAVALGHPIGASGARILTTLLYGLRRLKLKTGIAAICNGGGEATAVLIETI